MTQSFEQLKRNSRDSFSKLTEQLEKLSDKKSYSKDEGNYWKPEVDKAGNGFAVIRFLPAPQGEDVPFVQMFDHGFQGPTGKWYIENSLTTLGQKDPVSELNSQLWNSTKDDDHPNRQQARKQKRRLSYIANVYVVKDPAHPENEGKVFLYKFGKKIWDKIQAVMYPEFEGDEATNPFDLWEGANFRLKIRNVAGYRNYDQSQFDPKAPLLDDDEKLEKIWASEHSLKKIVDPSNFKSYDELKAQLDRVLGAGGVAGATAADIDEDVAEYVPKAKAVEARPAPVASAPSLDEDDDLDYFRKLAE